MAPNETPTIGTRINEPEVQLISRVIVALLATNHCLVTDRPDVVTLPSDLSWTTDFSELIDALQKLIIKHGAHTVTGQEYMSGDIIQVRGIGSDHECNSCNSRP